MKMLMAKNQRDYICAEVNSHMMEWGSGGSSLYFADRVPKLTTIEHNPKWYKKLKGKLPNNVDYRLHEREAIGKYSEEDPIGLWKYLHTEVDNPDVILIDGVARGACLVMAYRYYPKATVFLHDAWRDWYDWAVGLYPKMEEIPADEGDYPPLLIKLNQ
jgi:hypothetical protein